MPAAVLPDQTILLEALKIAHGQSSQQPTTVHLTTLHNSHVITLSQLLTEISATCDDKDLNPHHKLGRIRKLIAARACGMTPQMEVNHK